MEYHYTKNRPVVTVSIKGKEEVELTGLLDSGADYCTSPVELCDLILEKIRKKTVSVASGSMDVDVYSGTVRIEDFEKQVEIVGINLTHSEIDCLIGRNFMQYFDLLLLRDRFIIKF